MQIEQNDGDDRFLLWRKKKKSGAGVIDCCTDSARLSLRHTALPIKLYLLSLSNISSSFSIPSDFFSMIFFS